MIIDSAQYNIILVTEVTMVMQAYRHPTSIDASSPWSIDMIMSSNGACMTCMGLSTEHTIPVNTNRDQGNYANN